MTCDNLKIPSENIVKSSNIVWIDIAKFIGIILVIFQHSTAYIENDYTPLYHIQAYINLFHMPLFVVLAGFLYKDKGLKNNYSKILWALLVPYVIYQTLFLPFRLGEEVFYNHVPVLNALRRLLTGILTGDVVENNLILKVCAPLWFLVVMMQIRIIFSHIKLSVKNLIFTALFSVFAVKFLLLNKTDLYFCVDITLYLIPFFIFGIFCKRYWDKLVKISELIFKNKYVKALFCTVVFGILVYIYKINGYLHLARFTLSYDESESLSLYYIAGLLGTVATCIVSGFFKNENKFVETIAKNTLFVLYFHWQLLFFLRWFGVKKIMLKYLYVLNPVSVNAHHLIVVQSVLICILFTAINLIINYYVIKFLDKKHPLILGKHSIKPKD